MVQDRLGTEPDILPVIKPEKAGETLAVLAFLLTSSGAHGVILAFHTK